MDFGLRIIDQDAASIMRANSSNRPLVGIVGEIYIRSNRFGNENLIKKVEELGGEAVLAPLRDLVGAQ